MAASKVPFQIACSNCKQGNQPGSPYCSRCGAPLSEPPPGTVPLVAPVTTANDEDSFKRFLSEGQDRTLVKQSYDRAFAILTTGETIEYIAVAGRTSLAHSPDCVVATDKRIMLFRKRVLGKYELDDCYWRDVRSAEMKDGKNGITLSLEAIQGWHIAVESLPKAQAWRINEIAAKRSDRLRDSAHEHMSTGKLGSAFAAQSSGILVQNSSVVHPNAMQVAKDVYGTTSLPPRWASEPVAAPSQSVPSAPVAPSMGGMGQAIPLRPIDVLPPVEVEQEVDAAPSPLPTPESVLQTILQQTQGVSDGAPTRPIQFAAAAFQAPTIADAPPVTIRETTTDPHMRPVPPMPTLEQIAVFSGPLAFNHISPSEGSTPFNMYSTALDDPGHSYGDYSDTLTLQPSPEPETKLNPKSEPPGDLPSPILSNHAEDPLQENGPVVTPVVAIETNDASTSAPPLQPSQTWHAPAEKEVNFDAPMDVANVIGYMLPTAPNLTSGPLPLPGSLTSGPLLAANPPSSTDTILFSQIGDQVSGSLSTQHLYYDSSAESDADRPTDINLGQYSSYGIQPGKSSRSAAGSSSSKSGKGSGSGSTGRSSQSKAAADDPISKMKQLKMLLDAGFITDADYEAKKADILARFF